MEIRFAKPQDVPGILDLLKQIGRLHHNGRPDIFRERAQKYGASGVLALLENHRTPVFVAVEGTALLGYAICQVDTVGQDPVLQERTTLYLDDLCVDEARRGEHIGTGLYQAVCQYAKERKCDSVTLNVWAFNEEALAFYTRLGMKPLKITMETILEDNVC